ncbi:MAG: hypothetical protein ACRBN8_03815 [Nannocystales bacterium]
MGLFDRKRPEEEDIAPQPAPAKPAPTPVKAAAPKKVEVAAKPIVTKPVPAEPAKPAYGIQNAIELMRQLPSDNVPLVVEVVKKTLESLHVDIRSIIADAERKRARIDDRVVNLQAEIDDFEEEIAARKDEIEALTGDRDETRTVKERLELALQGAKGAAAKPSPAASLPPPGGIAAQAGVIGSSS